ncbi:hypothetical protein HAX54_025094, partial [Datura stramonium]|nr:hypothetical protein [Datura stramonium]
MVFRSPSKSDRKLCPRPVVNYRKVQYFQDPRVNSRLNQKRGDPEKGATRALQGIRKDEFGKPDIDVVTLLQAGGFRPILVKTPPTIYLDSADGSEGVFSPSPSFIALLVIRVMKVELKKESGVTGGLPEIFGAIEARKINSEQEKEIFE